MNRRELASKIDYEGGLVEAAFFYGLSPDDIDTDDTELVAAWTAMVEAWKQFEPAMHKVQDLLPEPTDDNDDDEFDPELFLVEGW